MRKALLSVGAILAASAAMLPLVASAITVGPVRLEYNVNPGDTVSGSLFLENEQTQEQTFYSSSQSFTETNGNRTFTTEAVGLPTWIHTSSSVTLAAGAQTEVPFTIDIPSDAPPGGQYAAIWWSTSPPPKGGGQFAVVSRAGILVYLQVSGNIKEAAQVTDLRAPASVFWTSSPMNIDMTFTDTGNTYLKPGGAVNMINIFGITQASAVVNPYGVDFLPQAPKGTQVQLDPPGFVLGPYRIQAAVTYGANNNQTATETVWVWLFPWPVLTWLAVLIIFIFFVLPIGIRRYNRWIIAKSRNAS